MWTLQIFMRDYHTGYQHLESQQACQLLTSLAMLAWHKQSSCTSLPSSVFVQRSAKPNLTAAMPEPALVSTSESCVLPSRYMRHSFCICVHKQTVKPRCKKEKKEREEVEVEFPTAGLHAGWQGTPLTLGHAPNLTTRQVLVMMFRFTADCSRCSDS